MKMPIRMISFAVSDAAKCCVRRKASASLGRRAVPAIAKRGVVFDLEKSSIESAELVSDAFDRRADIGSEPLFTAAGDEARVVNAVVDRAIGNVFAGARHQHVNDLELGHGQIDVLAVPISAPDIGAQQELAALQGLVGRRCARASAQLHDEAQALGQYRYAARLVDEIDCTAIERRVL